jgi:hypothetical protein
MKTRKYSRNNIRKLILTTHIFLIRGRILTAVLWNRWTQATVTYCVSNSKKPLQNPNCVNGTAGCEPKTHTKRQATQHGCLPSLLGDEDKGIEIVYSEVKNILYCADYRAAKAEQNLLYRHNPNEPTKEGPLSFVLFVVPIHLSFNSQQGHPSLVFLE